MRTTIKYLATLTVAIGMTFGAFADSYDDQYTAATGYVTLLYDDDSTGHAKTSFEAEGNWSDVDVPHNTTNYYVASNRRLYTPSDNKSHEFKGWKLVIRGMLSHNAFSGGSVSYGDVELLPGSTYYFSSVGSIAAGDFTISGTEEKPSVFWIKRTSGSFTIQQAMNMHGDGVMSVEQRGPISQTFSYTGDWTDFRGTLIMPTNLTIRVKNDFGTPGTFRTLAKGQTMLSQQSTSHTMTIGKVDVPSGGDLTVSNTARLTAGDLSVGSGARLGFASTGTGFLTHVTNRLDLADGAAVGVQAFDCTKQGSQTSLVFRLSPQAVSAGLPDWDKISFSLNSLRYAGGLPHADAFVMDDPEVSGGKYMGLATKPIVCMTNMNLVAKSACDTTYNHPEQFWSNGRFPEEGYDYLALQQFLLRNCGNPYVFPGDSMTLRSTPLMLDYTANDVTFADLTLAGACLVRPLTVNTAYVLRGKLALSTRTSSTAGAARVKNANGVTITIASEIVGDNNLDALLADGNGSLTSLYGTLVLTGLNTNWTGKLAVTTQGDTYTIGGVSYAVNAVSNLTLRVSDARNLGGPMAAFAYDSLVLSNNCRLAVDATTTFDEPTRGWYFPRNVFLRVADGATATCKNTITLGGGIVKEGAGTLCLASTPVLENGSATISVEAGTLAVGKSDALKNIDVSFAAGTTFAVDVASNDADMRTKGVDLTSTTVTKADAALKLSLLGLPETPGERGCGPYAVCTYSSSSPIAFKPMKGPWSGVSVRAALEEVDNGDGTKTLMVTFVPTGIMLIVQ